MSPLAILLIAGAVLANSTSGIVPPISVSAWTGDTDLGDADEGACTIVAEDEITVDADGSTDGETGTVGAAVNGHFCYQEIAGGDVQIIARFVEFDALGYTEQFTYAGVCLWDSISSTARFACFKWPDGGLASTPEPSFKYRELDGGTITASFGPDGLTAPPICLAITHSLSSQTTQVFYTEVSTCDSGWVLFQETTTLAFGGPYYAGVFAASHSAADVTIAEFDTISVGAITLSGAPPGTPRTVDFVGDFETGGIQNNTANPDGFLFQTLTTSNVYINTQTGDDASTGCSDCDGKVVDTTDMQLCGGAPRTGNYALRERIYKASRDYSEVNGNGQDKPRNNLQRNETSTRWDFDEEMWLGFSFCMPVGWEFETTASMLVLLQVHHPNGGGGHVQLHMVGTDWVVRLQVCDDDVAPPCGTQIDTEISAVDDVGDWVDWVFRVRPNPYGSTSGCDPCVAPDGNSYPINTGILQAWKSDEGVMSQVVDRTSLPVGLEPLGKNYFSFDLYKPGWHTTPGNVAEPITAFWDSIHYGLAANGTGYEDVHPDQEMAP